MKKILFAIVIALFACTLCGCNMITKKAYNEAPHVMTLVDEAAGYSIYEHDETGVWYFCRDGGYGRSVVVMVNPDGTPYVNGN